MGNSHASVTEASLSSLVAAGLVPVLYTRLLFLT